MMSNDNNNATQTLYHEKSDSGHLIKLILISKVLSNEYMISIQIHEKSNKNRMT